MKNKVLIGVLVILAVAVIAFLALAKGDGVESGDDSQVVKKSEEHQEIVNKIKSVGVNDDLVEFINEEDGYKFKHHKEFDFKKRESPLDEVKAYILRL